MTGRDIIVIGASAGGVAALPRLIATLPATLPASILIVLHIPADAPDLLPRIICRVASLPASHATDGQKIQHGNVYLAPPDHHMEVDGSHVRLTRGPRESRHRPAIDRLFCTAAESYGPRVVGVVLTGHLDDGTAGLNSVKTHGGIAIVQDPTEAEAPAMPQSALRNVKVDHCLRLAEIGLLLVRLATKQTLVKGKKRASQREKRNLSPQEMEKKFGPPTCFVCPECSGPLWETQTEPALRFHCHVGHGYSPASLLADHRDGLERALWSAVRTFEEQAALARRLKERGYQSASVGPHFEARAKEHEKNAQLIRKILQAKR